VSRADARYVDVPGFGVLSYCAFFSLSNIRTESGFHFLIRLAMLVFMEAIMPKRGETEYQATFNVSVGNRFNSG
jgi:hypothetical protein